MLTEVDKVNKDSLRVRMVKALQGNLKSKQFFDYYNIRTVKLDGTVIDYSSIQLELLLKILAYS